MAEDMKTAPSEDTPVQPLAQERPRRSGWFVAGIVAASLLLLFIITSFGFVMGRVASTWMLNRQGESVLHVQTNDATGGRMMMGARGGYGGYSYTTTGTMKTGVVTAIDGATLTVAGDGTTIKVVTDSSTTYTGATTPVKVNDTVRIATNGAQADGSYKAVTVHIGRQ